MRHVRKPAIAGIVAGFWLVAAATLASASTDLQFSPEVVNEPSAGNLGGASDQAELDTEMLAKAYGMSVEDMRSQLATQDKMDTVDFKSLDPGYVEYGSNGPGPDFRLWYRSADPPSDELRGVLAELGVIDQIDFLTAPHSLDELLELAKQLEVQLKDAKLPVQVSLATEIGGVTLLPLRMATDDDLTRAQELARGLRLNSTVEAPPTAMQIGGRKLESEISLGDCTGGFVAVKNGNRTLLSAAHCANDGIGEPYTYDGFDGFFVIYRKFTSQSDIMTVNKNGVSWQAETIFGENGVRRDVTDTRTWAQISVGDPVAKWGQKTKYSRGEVVDKYSCGAHSCTTDSRFIRVDADPEYNQMCLGGDSGGPFMFNLTAYGILSAGYLDGDCTFMATSTITTQFDAVVLTQ